MPLPMAVESIRNSSNLDLVSPLGTISGRENESLADIDKISTSKTLIIKW